MPVVDFPASQPPHTVCWVRVTNERSDGFVEFDFAIGDPDLCVDLIMPRAAFEEFCVNNRVRQMDAEQGHALDAEQARWKHGPSGMAGDSA